MNFLFEFRPQVCAQSEPTNQVQIENWNIQIKDGK